MNRGWLVNLGLEPYDEVLELQHRLVEWRAQEVIGDGLLLLEHQPVITLGRRGDAGHILVSAETLAREGITVRRVERGGDVTYHGPGQLVGYPIVHLPSHGLGASDYMHRLEDVIAAAMSRFGIETSRRGGLIGVWVNGDKIAAFGVRIRHGVAFHGFALNVSPIMKHWTYIVPCGISDGGVTSMEKVLGYVPPMTEVRESVAREFAALFGMQLEAISLSALEASMHESVAPAER